MISTEFVGRQLQRILDAGFQLPYGSTIDGMTGVYRDQLDRFSEATVADAVGRVLSEHEGKWPKVAQIRTAAFMVTRERARGGGGLDDYLRWFNGTDTEQPCPICWAEWYAVHTSPMMRIDHDFKHHQRAQAWPVHRFPSTKHERFVGAKR